MVAPSSLFPLLCCEGAFIQATTPPFVPMKSREDALSQQSAVTCPASDLSGTCVWTTRGFRRAESRFSSTTRISPRAEATASILSSGESLSRTIDPRSQQRHRSPSPPPRSLPCSSLKQQASAGARGAPRRQENTLPERVRTQSATRRRGPLQAPRGSGLSHQHEGRPDSRAGQDPSSGPARRCKAVHFSI